MKVCCDQHSSPRGVSFVEMMITVSIMSMLVLAIAPFFNLTQKGFTSMEAHNSLKTAGQEAINRIGTKLTQSKRFFENASSSKIFKDRATLTTPPAPLTGSLLPSIEEVGSLSPGSTNFVSASVGNCIFFASVEAPQDLTVLNGAGTSVSVRIDNYIFNYYFLGPDNTVSVGGRSKINLWEWHSKRYADYIQLNTLTDATEKLNAAKALFNAGTL